MNDRPLSDDAAGFVLQRRTAMKRIIIGYFAASVVAMAVSNWALHPSTASAFSFLMWVAPGPIGVLGFATLDMSDVMWPIKDELYYLAGTAGLAACLWYIQGKSDLHRRIARP
jgi:hypothetical protein